MIGPAAAAAVVRMIELAITRRVTPLELGASVWIALGVVVVALQGQFFGHYILPLAAPLAILAMPVFAHAARQLATRRTDRVVSYTLLAVSFALPVPFIVALEPGVVRDDPVAATARYIDTSTPPDDAIFVWGNEPYVYLSSQRRPSGRFVYMFPLTHPRYATPALVDGLLADWEQDPPSLIVDASNNPTAVSAHPLLGAWIWDGDPVLDHLAPLREFVRERYHEAERLEGWIVYAAN
jgi:hypothetical protein